MFQKTLVITAVISIILISLLFTFVFISTDRNLMDEHTRIERYIYSTVSNGVHSIRNEILYLFEHYSSEIGELNYSGWDGRDEDLYPEEVYQLENFPSLVKDVEYFTLEEVRSMFIIREISSFEMSYKEVLTRMSEKIMDNQMTIIHIIDFEGYMVFPVNGEDDEQTGFLVIFLDLSSVIDQFLPEKLLQELQTGTYQDENKPRPLEHEYTIQLVDGEDLDKEDHQVVVDLNREFNLFNVKDYYYTQPDSFMPLTRTKVITDNHTYLVINHGESDPGAFLWKRIRTFTLLALAYLFLVGVLLTFLYSVYRIKKEYQREQQFTSLISHELKTPLSVIQLASDSLAGGYVEGKEDVSEYGAMIKEETVRLGRMIENILLISTLSWKGRNMEQIALADLFEDLHRENVSLLKSREISWEADNLAEIDSIATRPVLLKAALQNVIHNGIAYGAAFSEDRKIILRGESCRKKGKEGILFSVIDHGPGISWSESQKIFSNYYRGKEVSEKQLPGSGMGLALSKRIAEGLGGSLTLNRSMKKETVFEFWIPVRKNNEENIDD